MGVEPIVERAQAGERAALGELIQTYHFEESSYERIAAAMGLPMITIKSHLLRGKERMARLLAQPIPAGPSRPRIGALIQGRLSLVAA